MSDRKTVLCWINGDKNVRIVFIPDSGTYCLEGRYISDDSEDTWQQLETSASDKELLDKLGSSVILHSCKKGAKVVDTKKLLKLLNINIIDSTKDLEIPALSELIDNLIFAVTHPHDIIKGFYRQQWDKLDKIENAVERAGKACQVARKVLEHITYSSLEFFY